MNRLLFSLTLCVSAPVIAGPPVPEPVPVERQTVVRFVYVGFTGVESTGFMASNELSGIPVMNQLCQNEFGEAARAATTSDIDFVQGPLPDVSDKEGIWVLPSYPIHVFPDGLGGYDAYDSVGAPAGMAAAAPSAAIHDAACGRFTSAGTSGPSLKLNSQGFPIFRVEVGGCNIARPLACSLPKKVPVSR